MPIWMSILLSLVSKLVMPYVVELLKQIFEKAQTLPRPERTAANREALRLVKGCLRKKRGKPEYSLVKSDDDVVAELEAFLAKLGGQSA